ncbi:Uncharacterised protein [Mycobacteroides abscessus subsp. abscessus]|nr:Uncharacterised protein [Mycobacteroides abscessus subsp. abscessus]
MANAAVVVDRSVGRAVEIDDGRGRGTGTIRAPDVVEGPAHHRVGGELGGQPAREHRDESATVRPARRVRAARVDTRRRPHLTQDRPGEGYVVGARRGVRRPLPRDEPVGAAQPLRIDDDRGELREAGEPCKGRCGFGVPVKRQDQRVRRLPAVTGGHVDAVGALDAADGRRMLRRPWCETVRSGATGEVGHVMTWFDGVRRRDGLGNRGNSNGGENAEDE